MKCLSIFILSYQHSKHLKRSVGALIATLPQYIHYEVFIDTEEKRTGIENIPARYREMYNRSSGTYILTTGDDFLYFPGWFEECMRYVKEVPYLGIMSHKVLAKVDKDWREGTLPEAPIKPKPSGYHTVHHVAGPWFFHRGLWETCPFWALGNKCKSLDSNYANYVNKTIGKRPAYTNWVLAYHLGYDRRKGVDNA